MFKSTIGFLGFLILVGCESSGKKLDTPKVDSPSGVNGKTTTAVDEQIAKSVTQQAATDVGAQYFAEVEFELGSTGLSLDSKTKLQSALAKLKGTDFRKVMILSWADDEMPSEAVKSLSSEQRKLADKRNKSLSQLIKHQGKFKISTYNLAEQPNVFQKWFNTKDAQLKNALLAAGLPTTEDSPKYPSKARHAVLLFTKK